MGVRVGIDFKPISASRNIITVIFYSHPNADPCLCSLVYGPPNYKPKAEFWECLNSVAASFAGAWLCPGDFNRIVSQDEKPGGRPFNSSSPPGLAQLIQSHSLIDLGFADNKFTWSNKRENKANIKERLDRGIANIQWRELFPRATFLHLPAVSSDHNPLLLNTDGENNRKPCLFHFKAMWTSDPSCRVLVPLYLLLLHVFPLPCHLLPMLSPHAFCLICLFACLLFSLFLFVSFLPQTFTCATI